MLNFIGIGSAFNTKLGNTSSFIKNQDSILIFDCGGNVFSRLIELGILNGVEDIKIVLTHTHADHVGSLSDLVLYSYYYLKKIPKVYFPDVELIKTFFNCTGVSLDIVEIIGGMDLSINMSGGKTLTLSYIPVNHVPNIPSYGMTLEFDGSKIYLSGDSNEIPINILRDLQNGEISRIYQDTCGLEYENNVHLSLNNLIKLIPENLREKVYCIHHDNELNISKVEEYGFKVAKAYEGKGIY